MKLKVGNKFVAIREEKRLNQDEMAELLGISTSAYARMERNEVSPDIEQLVKYSQKLEVPIQEFLPDTVSITNRQNMGQAGILFGNLYYYADVNQQTLHLSKDISNLENENRLLKEQIELLKNQINILEKSKM